METSPSRAETLKALHARAKAGYGHRLNPIGTMSDAAFAAMYDPQGTREKQLVALLERVALALEDLAQGDLPVQPPRPAYTSYSSPIKSSSVEMGGASAKRPNT